jgi:transposase InsO family protein
VDLTGSNRREDNDDAYSFLNRGPAGCDFNERWHLIPIRLRCHHKSLIGTNYRQYVTRDEATRDIFEYIEVFYNRQRRHSTLG